MELQTAIETRRSIRGYDPEKKVSREDLDKILYAANQAPSWKNVQSGRYDVVCSEEMRKRLLACLPPFNARNAADAPVLIVTSYRQNQSGFDVPDGEAVNELGNGWGLYDLGLQNMNLLLTAKELGLDTLVMGIRDAAAIRELLAIDEKQEIVAVISLGYAAKEPREKVRMSIEEFARFH